MGVVWTCGGEVGTVEEGEVVFGVGIVGDPGASEPKGLALCDLFAEGGRGIDVEFDVDAAEGELLLDVFAEVEIAACGSKGDWW